MGSHQQNDACPGDPAANLIPVFVPLLSSTGFASLTARTDDVLKKEYLTEALDHDLHLAVITLSSGLTYTQYRDTVGDAAVLLERFRPSRPLRTPGKAYFRPLSFCPAPAQVSATLPIAGRDPNTMDWEPTSSNVRVKWVSEAEKERHRKERLCIRCSTSGHFIHKCPYRPIANPAPCTRTVGASPPVVVPPVLDDGETPTEEKQGKE
ncbi:hypothetical protein VTO42DRAFT_1414 [Malbranchea cinnamomea]